MSQAQPDQILTALDRGVLTVTFNRPEKKNAFTVAMYESLSATLKQADTRKDVRVVLLTGAGGAFTGGNDLADFAGNPPTGEDSAVFQFLLAIAKFEKPLVAAVDGPAIGVGTTLLLHCDLAYASDKARFQLPFVNLALCPEAASTLLLPARAGALMANEALLFGEPFDSATALSMRLINKVVPAAELASFALERCVVLAQKPPEALRVTKRLMRAPLQAQITETLAREGAVFMERLGSPEAQEAFTAFFEKRKPDFSKF